MKFKVGDRVIVIENPKRGYFELYEDILSCYGIIKSIAPSGAYLVQWHNKKTKLHYFKGYFTEEIITLDRVYYRNKTIQTILHESSE
jgi:hypothetical protein